MASGEIGGPCGKGVTEEWAGKAAEAVWEEKRRRRRRTKVELDDFELILSPLPSSGYLFPLYLF